MKAIVYRSYGSPDILECVEIDMPVPGDDQVLVKVRAASANPLDWHFMRGEPYLVRAMTGLRKPKDIRLGRDLAGVVVAIGKNATTFRKGDEVFGVGSGSFGEYVCAEEKELALKPANITFDQAAAVPIAGLTALQGLRDQGKVAAGQKVLINGAAGGVGTFAVQIAKAFDAEVTGVCSTRNLDLVRSIGAAHVIDYTKENFTERGELYDVVFDCVGNHTMSETRRILNPKGTYVPIGGPTDNWMIGPIASSIGTLIASPFMSQTFVKFFVAKISKDDLEILGGLIEAGKVTPVINNRYRLEEVPAAIRYLEEGHARGKVVIEVTRDE